MTPKILVVQQPLIEKLTFVLCGLGREFSALVMDSTQSWILKEVVEAGQDNYWEVQSLEQKKRLNPTVLQPHGLPTIAASTSKF
jgi:hypothetical protein